jgi:hypothetical protein
VFPTGSRAYSPLTGITEHCFRIANVRVCSSVVVFDIALLVVIPVALSYSLSSHYFMAHGLLNQSSWRLHDSNCVHSGNRSIIVETNVLSEHLFWKGLARSMIVVL